MNSITFATNYEVLLSFLSTNPYCSVLPATSHDFYAWQHYNDAYEQLSLLVPDGMPIVWGLGLISWKRVVRMYGPEIMAKLLRDLPEKKHMLLGSADSFAYFKKTYPKHMFSMYELPQKNTAEELVTPELVTALKKEKPDMVWIGVGSPKQVEVCALEQRAHPNATYFCVGAAFDFLSGVKPQAPLIMRAFGLEWLFRLVSEPKRLWKRYLIQSPIGLFRFLSCLTQVNVV